MPKLKVRTLRPLNGEPIGKIKEYDESDARRLAEAGAVKILGPAKSEALKPPAPPKWKAKPSAAGRRKAVVGSTSNKAKGPAASNKAITGLDNK